MFGALVTPLVVELIAAQSPHSSNSNTIDAAPSTHTGST
jgi:hypothetical protein